MDVARLAQRFDKLSNLKLAKTTLYALCDYEDDELAAIVTELAKHAKTKWLKPREAERYIWIAQARLDFGDYSDATLLALYPYDLPRDQAVIEALKAANPKTDDAAELIIKPFKEKAEAERAEQQAELEAQEAKREQDEADRMDAPPDEPEDVDPEPAKPRDIIDPPPVTPQAMPGGIGPMLSDSPEDDLLRKANDALKLALYEGDGAITDELVDACDRAATAWKRLHSELRARQEKFEAAPIKNARDEADRWIER